MAETPAVPAPAAVEQPRPARPSGAPRASRAKAQASGPGTVEAASALGLDASVIERLSPRLRGLLVVPERETAQHYYTKSFKETRTELIQRLLDPPLTLEETARILNVCPMTVRRYTNRGALPHFRTVGDQRRFRLSDVLAFMESQGRVGSPTEDEA